MAAGAWVYRDAMREVLVNTTVSSVTEYISGKYAAYQTFKGLIEHNYSNPVSLHVGMVKTVATAKYRGVHDYVSTKYDRLSNTRSTAVKTGDDTHTIEYYLGEHVYTITIDTPARFEEVLQVYSETGENVIKHLLTYMGPAHDFHGRVYTPKQLGFATLKFSNGLDTLEFSDDEPIVLEFPELG